MNFLQKHSNKFIAGLIAIVVALFGVGLVKNDYKPTLLGAAVFSNDCSSLAAYGDGSPYTATGETVTSTSGECKITINTTSNEIGLRANVGSSPVKQVKFDYRVDPSATLSGEHNLMHGWSTSYASDLFEIRINPSTASSTGYLMKIVDPANSYASVQATKILSKGVTYNIELRVGTSTVALYINGAFQVQKTGMNTGGSNVGVISFGKFYTSGFSGSEYFDNILLDVAPTVTASTTAKGKIDDVYAGYNQRYLRSDGAVVRPNPQGNCDTSCSTHNGGSNYSSYSDVVSEGQAYELLYAVTERDQTTFNLVENWTYNNLERRNHPTFNTTLGGRGGHLMGYHYADDTNTMYDWNYAPDADFDRVRALLWADAVWGSSGSVNYKARALDIIADLKNYAFIYDSTTGGQYVQSGDYAKNNPFEQNASYADPALFRLIYKYTGDSFWNQAVVGTYDVLTKLTDNAGGLQTTTGLVPNWNSYSTSTHDVATSTGRDTNYTYDAFRAPLRIYWDYLFYGSAQAKAYLTGNFSTFISTQWSSSSAIYAEYTHYGACNGSCYEASIFYWPAYFARLITPSDTIASTMYTNKMANNYKTNWATGSFYTDGVNGSGYPSYFGDSWGLFGEMTKNGYFIDESGTSGNVQLRSGTIKLQGNTTFK